VATFDAITLVVLLGLGALFIGYATGRRTGYWQGRRSAATEVPLRLRQEAIRTGKCPVCDHAAAPWYNGQHTR